MPAPPKKFAERFAGLAIDENLLRSSGRVQCHNLIHQKTPEYRILCHIARDVSNAVKWLCSRRISFSVLSSGHCYQGSSQSSSAVIDLSEMDAIAVDQSRCEMTVGPGAMLMNIYKALAEYGLAFPGGSCPTVTISGSTLGGGYGLMSRAYGLSCDRLKSIEYVDASGKIDIADERKNSELFWAVRGGGGSLCIVTKLTFSVVRLESQTTFEASWRCDLTTDGLNEAIDIFDHWQGWATSLPNSVTALFRLQKLNNRTIEVSYVGIACAPITELMPILNEGLRPQDGCEKFDIQARSVLGAAEYFAGNMDYTSTYMVAKSDVLSEPIPRDGIHALVETVAELPPRTISLLCDPLGGAISDVAPDETAFPHRHPEGWYIQYYSEWSDPTQSELRQNSVLKAYNSLRPFANGAAYLNYMDLDIQNFPTAYWSGNAARLSEIKSAYDPENIISHAQSIPLK